MKNWSSIISIIIPLDFQWGEKFASLCEALRAHISKEEGKIFTEAKAVLSEEIAKQLVSVMQDLKKQKIVLLKEAS